MPKRIAIFCDGTWNGLKSDMAPPGGADGADREPELYETNIVRLWELLSETDAEGVPQVAMYLPGVGNTAEKDAAQIGFRHQATPVPRSEIDSLKEWVKVKGGGAFGWELDRKLLEAYRFLVDVYEPGDHIYVFGFSRGAYTARSLLGLVRNCGIVRGGSVLEQNLRAALTFYRSNDPTLAPGSPRMRAIRKWLSPDIATDIIDLTERDDPNACDLLKVAYLGVFDTVGALGVPSELNLLPLLFNGKYRFHDTRLSMMVLSARHALALDDRRITYPPTLFDRNKLKQLNLGTTDPAYSQQWYPGEHGAVGGGMPPDQLGLGHATLLWVAEGAQKTGLAFDETRLAALRDKVDAMAPVRPLGLDHSALDRWTMKMTFWWRRKDVHDQDQVSPEAETRWHADDAYRPAPLKDRAASLNWPD